jgi:Trypsin
LTYIQCIENAPIAQSNYNANLLVNNTKNNYHHRSLSTMTTKSNGRSLIVGGEEVPDALSVYPAFVWSGIAADGWGCGASLVHSDIAISAAHCAISFENNRKNYVGSTWITGENATYYPTQSILIHPDYDWESRSNDIVVIKLKGHSTARPFEYNTDSSFPPVNSTATVIGFGWIRDGGPFSQVLKKVDIDIFPFQVCTKTYENYPFKLSDETHTCAGTWEGGKDGCASDSGAPLLVGNTIIAITEDGIGCGLPGVPGYYVKVSTHARWISESICRLSDRPPKHCKNMDIAWTLAPTTAPSVKPTPFPTVPPTPWPPTLHPTTSSPTVSPAPTVSAAPSQSLAPSSGLDWRPDHGSPTKAAGAFLFWFIVAGGTGFLVGCAVRWLISRHRRRIYEKIPPVVGVGKSRTALEDTEAERLTTKSKNVAWHHSSLSMFS